MNLVNAGLVALLIAGCASHRAACVWPSESRWIETRSSAIAVMHNSQLARSVEVIVSVDDEETEGEYRQMHTMRIIRDSVTICRLATELNRAQFVRHPMFTVTPPIYAVFVDKTGGPLAAVLINDGFARPIGVRRVSRGWEKRDLLRNEAKYLGTWIGELEQILRMGEGGQAIECNKTTAPHSAKPTNKL